MAWLDATSDEKDSQGRSSQQSEWISGTASQARIKSEPQAAAPPAAKAAEKPDSSSKAGGGGAWDAFFKARPPSTATQETRASASDGEGGSCGSASPLGGGVIAAETRETTASSAPAAAAEAAAAGRGGVIAAETRETTASSAPAAAAEAAAVGRGTSSSQQDDRRRLLDGEGQQQRYASHGGYRGSRGEAWEDRWSHGGRDGAPPRRRWEGPPGPPDEERISHCLGRILRYRVGEYNLRMDDDGWVSVTSLLELPDLTGATLEDVRRVISSSFGTKGKRFELQETSAGETQVRALYRHMTDRPPRWNGSGRGGDRGFRRGPRMGFSQVPPLDEEASPDSAARFKMSPRGQGKERYDIEDEFDAMTVRGDGIAEQASKGAAPATSSSGASAATTADSNSSSPQEEVWERFIEPDTMKAWFWNPATEEVLWADDPPEGWEQFFTESGGRWWWQESTGRYFMEENAT